MFLSRGLPLDLGYTDCITTILPFLQTGQVKGSRPKRIMNSSCQHNPFLEAGGSAFNDLRAKDRAADFFLELNIP